MSLLPTIPRILLGETAVSPKFRPTILLHIRRLSSAPTAPPQIVSRRLLLQQRSKETTNAKSSSSSGSSSSKKVDEKPWPRSVQIAGYSALAASIPLTICTLVTEFKSLRAWLEGERPHDPNDRRIGKQLVQAVRTYWTTHGRFDNEESEEEKRSILEMAKNVDRQIPVQVYVWDQPIMTISLRGDVPVSLSSVGLENSNSDELISAASRTFAIEFPEDEEVNETSLSDGFGQERMVFSGDSKEEGNYMKDMNEPVTPYTAYGRKIREMTQTFSSWHYFEEDTADNSKSSINKMSPEEIRKSELEWREAHLQMQLIDPYCTRDIDEMQQELAQVRSELRKLNRWKWAKSILSQSRSS